MIEQPEHRKDAENIVLEQFVRALEKNLQRILNNGTITMISGDCAEIGI